MKGDVVMARNNNNNSGKKVNIDRDVAKFAKLTLKKFKKEQEDYYDSKKELKEEYYLELIDLLPEVIKFVIRYGYIRNEKIQETKTLIFQKLTDPKFVKVLKKEIKRKNEIENIKFMPIIIREILQEADKTNQQLLADDPNAKIYKLDDLVELSQLILKKKIKKMNKAGIPEDLAFDLLSILPTDQVLKISQNYRIRLIFDVLYDHSKGKTIVFKNVMKALVDEDYYPVFIAFALLERKEKFGSLTDAQKTFYIEVTNWCLSTMESLPGKQIESIIHSYVMARSRDASGNHDGNRRYALSTLSDRDYPKISKVVNNYMGRNPDSKKYF